MEESVEKRGSRGGKGGKNEELASRPMCCSREEWKDCREKGEEEGR